MFFWGSSRHTSFFGFLGDSAFGIVGSMQVVGRDMDTWDDRNLVVVVLLLQVVLLVVLSQVVVQQNSFPRSLLIEGPLNFPATISDYQ